jgi:small subunit ribosomal protein S8
MMTDPIADMLTRIRNANSVEKKSVEMPASAEKESVARVLRDEGFIEGYERVGEGPRGVLRLRLKYGPLGERVIHRIRRISKPGRRVYTGVKELPWVHYGMGISIVSTSKGVLSDRECRVQNAGGEILCEVY